jgi:hypothetical protein
LPSAPDVGGLPLGHRKPQSGNERKSGLHCSPRFIRFGLSQTSKGSLIKDRRPILVFPRNRAAEIDRSGRGEIVSPRPAARICAEHYDRDLIDVFAVQDEITDAIVTAIEPQICVAENFRSRRKPPNSVAA